MALGRRRHSVGGGGGGAALYFKVFLGDSGQDKLASWGHAEV